MNYFYSWVKGVVVISVIRVTACRPPSFAGGACLGTYGPCLVFFMEIL